MLYQKNNKSRKYQADDMVKAAVTEDDQTEHLWFRVVDASKDPLVCKVDCDPLIESVNYNDFMMVKRENIEEWLPPGLTEEQMYEYLYATYKEVQDYINQNPHEHG
jgi:hypothetical protein